MEDWIANGTLLEGRLPAPSTLRVTEIDLAEVTEPILVCPNDPDEVKVLSEVAPATRSGRSLHRLLHDQHRPLPVAGKVLDGKSDIPTRPLWIAPPTEMVDALIH